MLNLNVKLEPKTEQRIKQILEQHSDKENFFKDIIQNQVNELKNGIINTQVDLKKFEEKYQQSTEISGT
ncbi:MAG: hypothetical protein GY940_29420 [bacterium]|nr:hypothetical protein [bacterium]